MHLASARCKGGRPAGGGWMWADVQKGCGMGLGGYADLRVPSFVHTTLHTMHTILHTIFGHSVQLKSWFIRGFRGTAHYAHHFISLIYEIIKIPHVYISHWKKGVHGVQGGEKALEKAHKREKTREIACTLQSKMVCSEVCMACRRCAAHVGMTPLFLGVLLLPPTFSGGASELF